MLKGPVSSNNWWLLFLSCLLLAAGVAPARLVHAGIISETYQKNVILNARFEKGNTRKPAIIVLHGFLQTFSFAATANIIEALTSQGYTVLAPNLSLGVSNRLQSLQCRAIHQHTLKQDLDEIGFWTRWLKRKGYHSVILVGHSWGSQHALAYSGRADTVLPVKGIIAISLVKAHVTNSRRLQQIKRAKNHLKRKRKSLDSYLLSFCKKYVSTPTSYLSYAAWHDSRVIDEAGKLLRMKIPIYVVLGSGDNRVDTAWINLVRDVSKKLIVIKGANHFFSSSYELELADKLETVLADMVGGK